MLRFFIGKDDAYIYIISFSIKEKKSFIYDVVLKKGHKYLSNIAQETIDFQDKSDLFIENPNIHPIGFLKRVEDVIRPKLIQGEEYKIYQELIQRGWNKDSNKRPTAKEIVETLMEKEALLPDVNIQKMKEYQMKVIKDIPEFSISLLGTLRFLDRQ